MLCTPTSDELNFTIAAWILLLSAVSLTAVERPLIYLVKAGNCIQYLLRFINDWGIHTQRLLHSQAAQHGTTFWTESRTLRQNKFLRIPPEDMSILFCWLSFLLDTQQTVWLVVHFSTKLLQWIRFYKSNRMNRSAKGLNKHTSL